MIITPYTQKGNNDCSPTTIVNAISWANNWSISKKRQAELLRLVYKKCKTNREGTDDIDFLDALVHYGVSYNYNVGQVVTVTPRTVKNSVQLIYEHLCAGGAIALSHVDLMEALWHHSFWFAVSFANCFVGANVLAGCSWYACTPSGLAEILRMSCVDSLNRPEIYFLTKQKRRLKKRAKVP